MLLLIKTLYPAMEQSLRSQEMGEQAEVVQEREAMARQERQLFLLAVAAAVVGGRWIVAVLVGLGVLEPVLVVEDQEAVLRVVVVVQAATHFLIGGMPVARAALDGVAIQ